MEPSSSYRNCMMRALKDVLEGRQQNLPYTSYREASEASNTELLEAQEIEVSR